MDYPNPDMRRALTDLQRRFIYAPDAGLDKWIIHKAPGMVRGDCEDFALTLLWQLSGCSTWRFWWNIITFKAVIWHVTSYNGEPHAVLYYDGMWADNMEVTWYVTEKMRHKRRFPWIPPLVAGKFALAQFI